MDPETAKAALAFLGRCNLRGVEAPAYLHVVKELEAIAAAPESAAADSAKPSVSTESD